MQNLSGLAAVADRYDALLLDLWGVIHDGTNLYPGVHAALTQLRKDGKKIIMLSNAPRRAHKVEKVLNGLGIGALLYDAIVSSGESGYAWMGSSQNTVGSHYFYIGPDKDLDVADGLDFTKTQSLEEATFLLNVGFGSDEQSPDDWTPVLTHALEKEVPMICLNPDLEVVKLTGERFPCAGVIARAYEAMGGEVIWFGKPYKRVYDDCLRHMPSVGKSRILAVGDSLDTDIMGAQDFGIDSALVMGGILKTKSREQIEAMCDERGLDPTYIIPQLMW